MLITDPKQSFLTCHGCWRRNSTGAQLMGSRAVGMKRANGVDTCKMCGKIPRVMSEMFVWQKVIGDDDA